MKKTDVFVLRELDGEYLLIPRGRMTEKLNQLVTLSESAAWIYTHVENADSFESLLQGFQAEYDADEAVLREDLKEALDGMVEMEILCVSDPRTGW